MKILVSGTTGVGKSTISSELKLALIDKGFNAVVIGEEIIKSPLFKSYSKNIADWGFLAQLDFLLIRFKQWFSVENEISSGENKTIYIFDRHFLDDYIFSNLNSIKMSLSNFQRNNYMNLYNQLNKKFLSYKGFDITFYLTASFDNIMKRMNKRGRKEELLFPLDYWMDLYTLYYNRKKYLDKFVQSTRKLYKINTDSSDPKEIVKKMFIKFEAIVKKNENSN